MHTNSLNGMIKALAHDNRGEGRVQVGEGNR